MKSVLPLPTYLAQRRPCHVPTPLRPRFRAVGIHVHRSGRRRHEAHHSLDVDKDGQSEGRCYEDRFNREGRDNEVRLVGEEPCDEDWFGGEGHGNKDCLVGEEPCNKDWFGSEGPATKSASSAKNLATKSVSAAKNTAAKSAFTVKDTATKSASSAKNLATKTVSAAKNTAAKTGSVVKDTATKTASAAKTAASKTASSAKASSNKTIPATKTASTKSRLQRRQTVNQIMPYPLWIGHAGECRTFAEVFARDIKVVVQLALEDPPLQPPHELMYFRFPLLDGNGNDAARAASCHPVAWRS